MGKTNRIGYSRVVTSAARFSMKYSQVNEDVIRSYLVWCIYMSAGLVGAVALLTAYRVDLLQFLALAPKYLWVIPLAFIAQNSLTGLMMQLWLVARPRSDVFSDLTSILWVRYTLMMPRVMRMMAPLCAAVIEEVFFRGAVFLILIIRFPWIGVYWPIFVCTGLFVLQQVLQTDTIGQRVDLSGWVDFNFRRRLSRDFVHGKFFADTGVPCGLCGCLPAAWDVDAQVATEKARG